MPRKIAFGLSFYKFYSAIAMKYNKIFEFTKKMLQQLFYLYTLAGFSDTDMMFVQAGAVIMWSNMMILHTALQRRRLNIIQGLNTRASNRVSILKIWEKGGLVL